MWKANTLESEKLLEKMTVFTKAADLAQRAVTLTLFGAMVACGVGIAKQVREYKESVKEQQSLPDYTGNANSLTREENGTTK